MCEIKIISFLEEKFSEQKNVHNDFHSSVFTESFKVTIG